MGAPATSVVKRVNDGFFPPAWLPPGGRGNGLSARAWAPIAEIEPAIVEQLLALLAERRVPGYAAPHTFTRRAACADRWTLWVATATYTAAEDVLIAHLPRLLPA